jgi:hypothetical protein
LIRPLSQTLEKYHHDGDFAANVYEDDFIHRAVESLSGNLFAKGLKPYTHAILNPPYKKINSSSSHRFACVGSASKRLIYIQRLWRWRGAYRAGRIYRGDHPAQFLQRAVLPSVPGIYPQAGGHPPHAPVRVAQQGVQG